MRPKPSRVQVDEVVGRRRHVTVDVVDAAFLRGVGDAFTARLDQRGLSGRYLEKFELAVGCEVLDQLGMALGIQGKPIGVVRSRRRTA